MIPMDPCDKHRTWKRVEIEIAGSFSAINDSTVHVDDMVIQALFSWILQSGSTPSKRMSGKEKS